MKRVMHVTTGLSYGGAETQIKGLAIRLNRRGWEVSVVSMLPPGAYVDELKAAGICVYDLRMRRKVPDPRAVLRLASIVRRECPLVVHAHMIHANLLARITRLFVSIPALICTAHSITEGGRARELAYRLTDPLADLTTQVSEASRQRYIQVGAVPPHKIVYIPNGIDTSRFQPNPMVRQAVREQLGCAPDAFVWLTVGRLEPVKNHLGLLSALREVVAVYPHARLLIAGQGPLQTATEQRIAELGLAEQVRLLGVRHDIPDLLNAADAFVLPSLWEGMPLTLLEASATALPIVATDVGGNAEVVLEGKTGYLVPVKDTNALAQAMLRVMSLSEADRITMGQAGRKHIVQNFDLERVVDRWEALYGKLLRRKGISWRESRNE
jgi:glycosyltransferase involved in cell wall biosynthesis